MREKIKTGKITIRKYGQEYKFENNALLLKRGMPLIDEEFEITAAENIIDDFGNIVYRQGELVSHSLKTDENGITLTQELAYGKYNIYEVKTEKKYKLHEDYIMQVNLEKESISVNVDSDFILGTLKVCNNEQDNISFSIFDEKRKLILTGFAEKNSAVSFEEMIPVGVYYYTDNNKNLVKVKIENDTDIVLLEAQKSSINIRTIPKLYEDNEFVLYKVDDSGKPLMGAVFGLIDMYGTKICFSCSDKDGRVLFKHLQKGTYIIREVDAPNGYKRSERNIVFTIDDNWINQSKRILQGEKFEDVYIIISDVKHEEKEYIYLSKNVYSKKNENNCAAEKIVNAAETVFRAEIR